MTIVGVSMASFFDTQWAVPVVVLLSIAKFFLVGFYFMELKSANSFWKFIFVLYAIIIGSIFIILL